MELPNEVILEMKRIQDLIRKENFIDGKFTSPNQMHLTLKFLGEINEGVVEEVVKRLKTINFSKFDVELSNVGVFTPLSIKVIWVKLDGADDLQKKVDESLWPIFKPEHRFMGHITIARVKRVKDKKILFKLLKEIEARDIEFNVKSFNLMVSELFPEGSKYRVIENFHLA